MKFINFRNNKGFTLVELIIVMAMFLFITGASLSLFIAIIQGQKRILSEQQFLNQISYVEEYMSKALRMAKTDTITTDPTHSCMPEGFIYMLTEADTGTGLFTGIKFVNSENKCQKFSWNASGILEEIKGGLTTPLTSANNFIINYVKFSINGSNGSTFTSVGCPDTNTCGAWYMDAVQPRVTILFKITVPGESPKIIQTTISQRNLNVDSGQTYNGDSR